MSPRFSHFFIVASRQGDALLFDVGLSQLDWVPIRENAENDRINKFRFPSFFTSFSMLKQILWISPYQVFLLVKNQPIVLLHFPFGVFGQGALALVKEHVRRERYQEAIRVLYTINWNISPAMAYSALTTIIDALIVQPLNYNRETQLEGALAAFYAPTRTLSDLVVIEYRDHVLRYARRFFHHLLRHRRLQKAFLLANDIGAQDLFLDVHHMALHFKVQILEVKVII